MVSAGTAVFCQPFTSRSAFSESVTLCPTPTPGATTCHPIEDGEAASTAQQAANSSADRTWRSRDLHGITVSELREVAVQLGQRLHAADTIVGFVPLKSTANNPWGSASMKKRSHSDSEGQEIGSPCSALRHRDSRVMRLSFEKLM